ncbi:hypothetical protein [Flavobacterium sp. W22_SRS_FP1]|uniref:hypothetical protein n=1 Tax=Flavobacterium sp. W22_SRS_FP1 TaxID=3240276 RepID=UPI003F90046F
MKTLFFAIAFLLSITINAQEGTKISNVFVRVYDLQNKKISKGQILLISDTSIQLKAKKGPIKIECKSIGLIKTKHSAGNNILKGALIGGSFFALIGVATADPDAFILGYTAGEGAAAGAIVGGTAGAAIGAVTTLFKNSESYTINGDEFKFKEFKELITGLRQ